MKTIGLAVGVVVTIAVGMWATIVITWLAHFDPADFHE